MPPIAQKGASSPTVHKCIQKTIEYRFDGQDLVEAEKRTKPNHADSSK
jgi:hypothetical protein